jgi:HlyD family secretion protein
LKAAEAEYQSQRVKLESDLMSQEAGAATVNANHGQTKRQADMDKALYHLGVISGLAYKVSQGSDEQTNSDDLRTQRLVRRQKVIESQLAEQLAKLDPMRALKNKQPDSPRVRAGSTEFCWTCRCKLASRFSLELGWRKWCSPMIRWRS